MQPTDAVEELESRVVQVDDDFEFDREALNDMLVMKFRC